MWLAHATANLLEGIYRGVGAKNPPRLTQARLKFLGLNLDFSIEKARAGWATRRRGRSSAAWRRRWRGIGRAWGGEWLDCLAATRRGGAACQRTPLRVAAKRSHVADSIPRCRRAARSIP